MKNDDRYQLFCQLIDTFDRGCDYTEQYDAQLHDYHGIVLYQAESQVIKEVGNHPGITASELATDSGRTNSAYSQLIRKLKAKGWIRQERNETNNRQYRLYLTDEGEKIYRKHQKFENACYERTFGMLNEFGDEDFRTYIRIQEKLNAAFQLDIEDSSR